MEDAVLPDCGGVEHGHAHGHQRHGPAMQRAQRHRGLQPGHPGLVGLELRRQIERVAGEAIDAHRAEERGRRTPHDQERDRLRDRVAHQHVLEDALAIDVAVDPVETVDRHHREQEEADEEPVEHLADRHRRQRQVVFGEPFDVRKGRIARADHERKRAQPSPRHNRLAALDRRRGKRSQFMVGNRHGAILSMVQAIAQVQSKLLRALSNR